MLLHALGTISTYGISFLGQKSKFVLILRINLLTDGHDRWTEYLKYPHFNLYLQNWATKLDEMQDSILPNHPRLKNWSQNIILCDKIEDNLVFFAHKMDTLLSLRVILS